MRDDRFPSEENKQSLDKCNYSETPAALRGLSWCSCLRSKVLLAQVDVCAVLDLSIQYIRRASASSKLFRVFVSGSYLNIKSSRFFSSCVHPFPTFVYMHM